MTIRMRFSDYWRAVQGKASWDLENVIGDKSSPMLYFTLDGARDFG